MARAKYSVDVMNEGDWIVRGTQDPMTALALIVEHGDEAWQFDDMLRGVARLRPGIDDYELDQDAIAEMANWCHRLLSRARPGYYRKVHCLENSYGAGESWAWQLVYADGPGRGAFPGVYFRSWS